jgi:hypothetical protein
MPIQSDVPGNIALWLFRLGIIWAIALVPLTIVLFPLGVYGLVGLAVWLGWRWRSNERPALRVAAAFWLFSAAFNVAFVAYFIATGPHWTRVLFYDQTAYLCWWWLAATLASLVALAFEFPLQRHAAPAARQLVEPGRRL